MLSVAQLSSCGCIYFNKYWRGKGEKKMARMREIKTGGRRDKTEVDEGRRGE